MSLVGRTVRRANGQAATRLHGLPPKGTIIEGGRGGGGGRGGRGGEVGGAGGV